MCRRRLRVYNTALVIPDAVIMGCYDILGNSRHSFAGVFKV